MKVNTSSTRYGVHRTTYEKNKRKIIAQGDTCGICGLPVDKSLKFPHPMSATADHIIPLDKGGNPSDIDNLQLAHLSCNRIKSNKLPCDIQVEKNVQEETNRNLPLFMDWTKYRGDGAS